MNIKKVRVYTLGCRLNQVESEGICESFANSGFDCVENGDADLYIINSCTVTSKADQKTRRMARLFNSQSVCIVTGCYASTDAQTVEGLGDRVIALKSDYKGRLVKLAGFIRENPDCTFDDIRNFLSDTAVDATSLKFNLSPCSFAQHSRAFLKVQDGCDRFCSFCKVSIARGLPVSLDPEQVCRRIEEIQSRGYLEITLTGVNLALYNCGGVRLGGLVDMIASVIKPGVHLRFSSLEPDLIDDRLLQSVAHGFVNPYFHLPIQSASKKVLGLTGRRYDSSVLHDIICRLREAKSNPFIAADIIAGLPAEDDEAFRQTCDFIEKEELSALHVFPFSPREGTRAAEMKFCCQRDRDERAEKLRGLSARLYESYASGFVGSDLDAIAEKSFGNTQYFTSDNYLKIKSAILPFVHSGARYRMHIVKFDDGMLEAIPFA